MSDADKGKSEEVRSDAETEKRYEETLKRMLATKPKPHASKDDRAENKPNRKSGSDAIRR